MSFKSVPIFCSKGILAKADNCGLLEIIIRDCQAFIKHSEMCLFLLAYMCYRETIQTYHSSIKLALITSESVSRCGIFRIMLENIESMNCCKVE